MLNRNDYYMEILEYPKEELFNIINKSTAYILHLIKDKYNDDGDTPYDVVIDLVCLYSMYDGYVTEDKIEMFKKLFEMDIDNQGLIDIANYHKRDSKKRVKIMEELRKDDDYLEIEFLLGLAIYALDGEITKEEQALIEKNTRQDIVKYPKNKADA